MFFVIFILTISVQGAINIDCGGEDAHFKYLTKNNDSIVWSLFFDFTSTEQLNTTFSCDQIAYNLTEYVAIWPHETITHFTLTNEMTLLLASFLKFKKVQALQLKHLRGIDISSEHALVSSFKITKPILVVYLSSIEIYSDGRQIVGNQCPYANSSSSSSTNTFLNSFYAIYFDTVIYPKQWCPHFFTNTSSINRFLFQDISNSFIKSNRLKFIRLIHNNNNNMEQTQMVNLKSVYFSLAYERLSGEMVSRDLFRRITDLGVTGVLEGIEADLFDAFDRLTCIDIVLSNFRGFFYSGIAWMSNLNRHENDESKLKHSEPLFCRKYRNKIWLKSTSRNPI